MRIQTPRLKYALPAFAMALACVAAMPATAQNYSETCGKVRDQRQLAGAVLGGIIGGVTGHEVAGRGVRNEGAVLGSLVGALAGGAIGRNSEDCRNPGLRPDLRSEQVYTDYRSLPQNQSGRADTYGYSGDGYSPYEGGVVHHGDDPYLDSGRGVGEYGVTYGSLGKYPQGYGRREDFARERDRSGVDRRRRETYYSRDAYAGRECADAEQVTRLPDGREIYRPVEACRDAWYGDWKVRD
jgi:uncharacterized protein YcfJ